MARLMCPDFSTKSKVDDKFIGRKVRCPKCQVKLRLVEDGMVYRESDHPAPPKTLAQPGEEPPVKSSEGPETTSIRDDTLDPGD